MNRSDFFPSSPDLKARSNKFLDAKRKSGLTIVTRNLSSENIERNISTNNNLLSPQSPTSQRTKIDLKNIISPQRPLKMDFSSRSPKNANKKKIISDFLGSINLKYRKLPSRKLKVNYRLKWRQAITMIRVGLRLKEINEDIKMYGTSHNLFDLSTRDRNKVKNVLYPFSDSYVDKEKILPFPLIHPESKIKAIWNPIIDLFLLYCITVIPYRIIFIPQKMESDSFWIIWHTLLGFIFLCDIAINIISSKYKEDNTLEKSLRVLLRDYLNSWLIVDIFACIPFDLMSNFSDDPYDKTDNLQILEVSLRPRIFKFLLFFKVVKGIKIFGQINRINEYLFLSTSISRLLRLLVLFLITIHFLACIWYFSVNFSDPKNLNWLVLNGFIDKPPFSKYLYSLYYSVSTITTVGYGDIHATTKFEMIISIGFMLFGVFFYSLIIGILSSLLSYINTKKINHNKRIAIMNEFSKEMKLPKTLVKRLRINLEHNYRNNPFLWFSNSHIFEDLPVSIKYDVLMEVYNGVFSQFLFLKKCEDKAFVVRLISLLVPMKIQSRSYIWNKGSNPDGGYMELS